MNKEYLLKTKPPNVVKITIKYKKPGLDHKVFTEGTRDDGDVPSVSVMNM